MNRNLMLVIAAAGLFCSCRSTRNIQTAINKKDNTQRDTVVTTSANTMVTAPVEDSEAVIRDHYKRILSNHIDFTSFSANKIDVDYQDAEGKKYSVTAHVRMYKDSVIWVSITAILGIEGLRVLITADSVKILDKQNKTYIARSVSYLQEVTDLPLDLHSLQDLLLGNPVFLDSNIISYTHTGNTISLLSVGDLFRNLFTVGETDHLVQSSKLDDIDETHSRSCFLTYTQ
jgi:hypothetical protein